MKRVKIFTNHFDLGHGVLYNDYPKIYTQSLNVPGKYMKKINRRVHLKNGNRGEMDSAYIADPDYKILFEKAAVCLEHQSTPVNEEKLKKIGDYDTQLVVDEQIPTLIAIASKEDMEKSQQILKRTPSDITKLYFLNLTEENIYKRLSTVKEIINSNKQLTDKDAINLGIIVLYAPTKHACEITEEVVKLYRKIVESLSIKMQACLHLVLRIMIDAYFDDQKEYNRLIKMIDEKTSMESKYISAAHEATLESLKYTKEDLNIANGKIAELEAEIEKLKANRK